MDNQAVVKPNIIDRLESLFNVMVKDSDFIPKMLRPTINNLVAGYLQKATPSDVRKIIVQIRDDVIPYLLEE
jgi:hypothetical protein